MPTHEPGRPLGHVLLVDDEPEFLQELGSYLCKRGWTVSTSPSPSEALVQLDTHADIAVVVTDVRIANSNGFELAQRIRQERTGTMAVAVVVVTGHGDGSGEPSNPARQELTILRKPLAIDVFMTTLAAAMDSVRAERKAACGHPPPLRNRNLDGGAATAVARPQPAGSAMTIPGRIQPSKGCGLSAESPQ